MTSHVYAFNIEDGLPVQHPSRANFIAELFSSMQQSSWQWRRDGVATTKGDCQYWSHNGAITSVCLRSENSTYFLSFSSHHLKEVMQFRFMSGTHRSLKQLLEFDPSLMQDDLIHFSSARTGIQMDYKDGVLRFRSKIFGGFEFFSHTSVWNETGLRQEIYGRCSFCSARRLRAYINESGEIDYRSSSTAGRLNPREWNTFLDRAYYSVIAEFSARLNFMDLGLIHD
tara:strand:+ start:78 stop:758 length:681 start_codon:yes stop_codon:yes gene_type:complete